MALPTTITGLNLSIGTFGPFQSTAPAYYVFGIDSTTSTTFRALKTTDPTTSFSIQTNVSWPSAPTDISAVQSGNTIYFVAHTGTTVYYTSYNMSTDSFSSVETIASGLNTADSTGNIQYGVGVAVRSNGSVITFFNDNHVASMGKSYARLSYSLRTGGSWGASVAVDAGGAVDYVNPYVIIGASDRCHFLYAANINEITQRDLSSSNVLGTATATSGQVLQYKSCSTQPTSYTNGANTIINVPITGNPSGTPHAVYFTSGASPTLTTGSAPTFASNPQGSPYRAFVDGTTVYWLLQLQISNNWVVYSSTNSGSTYSLVGTAFTSSAIQPGANDLSFGGTTYQRNGAVVIPYVVNDNGTLKYNEYTVRTLVNYQTGAGSSSGVGTASGAGASGVRAAAAGSAQAFASGASIAPSVASSAYISQLNDFYVNIYSIGSTSPVSVGQIFTTTSAATLKSIDVWLEKFGGPTDNLQIRVYAVSGDTPTSFLGQSDVILGSSLSSSLAEYNFNFSTPITLNAATQYAFAVWRTGATDTGNFYGIELNSDVYSGGTVVYNDGSSWIVQSSYDLKFNINTIISSASATGVTLASSLGSSSSIGSASAVGASFNIQSGSFSSSGSSSVSGAPGSSSSSSGTSVVSGNGAATAIGIASTSAISQPFDANLDLSFGTTTTNTINAGQTFTPTNTITLESIDVWLRKAGSPTDNLQINVYDTISGLPAGSLGASTTIISGSSLTAVPTLCNFKFATPIILNAGTQYAFVANRSGASDNTNFYYFRASYDIYSGGIVVYYNGSSWSNSLSAFDLQFRVNAALSTASGTGVALAISSASASGTSTVAATGSIILSSSFTSSGSSSVSGAAGSSANSSGIASVSAISAAIDSSTASAAGVGSAVASSANIISSSGSASGTSSVSSQSAIIGWGQGVSLGDGAISWIKRTGTGNWYAVTSSDDGIKLAAINNTSIYTSNNSGISWTQQSSAGSYNWTGIASSSDGTKLAASTSVGYIYTSTDSGVTWTQQTGSGSRNWTNIASSSDGTKLVAADQGGYIYTSSDSGVTWTGIPITKTWNYVASSADGIKLAVIESTGYIYTSSDSGSSWIQRTSAGSRNWKRIKSSADGTKLIAISDQWVFLSPDSGVTWNIQSASGAPNFNANFNAIGISGDGNTVAVAATNGMLFISYDFGASWRQRTDIGAKVFWYDIASSYNGKKLAVVISNDGLYTLTTDGIVSDYAVGASTVGVAGIIYAGGDYNWKTNFDKRYDYIATSSDGSYLVIYTSTDNHFYTSNDYGTTWTQRASLPTTSIRKIVASTDCTKLAVATAGNYIYTSTDSGVTWTQQTGSGSRNWWQIASSADGTKLIASDYGGYVYTSIDSGVTWTQQTFFTQQYFVDLASSADGTKIFASNADGDGNLYTSTDSGVTWTARDPGGYSTSSHYWEYISSSADGSVLITSNTQNSNNGYGYAYISTDSGSTWTELNNLPTAYASGVYVSPDGTKFIVTDCNQASYDQPGKIYTSVDSGVTWKLLTLYPTNNRQFDTVYASPDLTNIYVRDAGSVLYSGKTYQAAAAPIASSTTTSSGIGNGTAVANPLASSTYSSAGTSTASGDPAAIVSGVGSSSGSSSVAGTNLLYSIGHGSSSGTGLASGIAIATDAAVASSSGVGNTSIVGRSITAAVASSSGTSAATSSGTSTAASTTSTSGSSATSGAGNAVVNRSVSSSGTSTVNASGISTAASTASAAGTSTASFTGSSIIPSIGSSSGSSIDNGNGASTAAVNAGSLGTCIVDGSMSSTNEAIASSSGSSSAAGSSHSSSEGDGTSAGSGSVLGSGNAIVPIIGSSNGTSNTSVLLVALLPTSYTSNGDSIASGSLEAVAEANASSISTSSASGFGNAITDITGSTSGTSDAQSVGTSVLDASYTIDCLSTAQAVSGLIQYANGIGTALCTSGVHAYAVIPPHDFVTIFQEATRIVTVHSSDEPDTAVIKNPEIRTAKVRSHQSIS